MPLCSLAQQLPVDSAVQLKEVTVTVNRLDNFSAGSKIETIDSAAIAQYKNGNLATLLANESPLFMKSYGLGSLATTSFRGGSANHTAILWNGFNLNNPMYGQVDVSLIPNYFMSSVNIQYGGTSALWGSGAVGGTILLNSDAKFNNGITVLAGATVGSFSSYGQNFSVELSKTKWISSIKFFNNSAKNDFEFYNTQLPESPKQNQTNAELKQYGLLLENYFKLNENQKINLRFWYQNNDRNIPPTMLQTVSQSQQKDESYRLTSEWQKTGEKITWLARVAYFNEQLIYADNAYDYHAHNRSQTTIAEVESKIYLNKNNLLNIGLNNTFATAVADGYPDKPKQNRTALFASHSFISTNSKFRSTLSARQEIAGNEFIPFTWLAGAEYDFLKWLSAKANASKVYRIPTFNDLHWNPGGNINLLPESGYCQEAGLVIKLNSSNSKIHFLFEPTIFNRNMDNWILWLPGQSYWSPQNIMEVWSRGVETRTELNFLLSKIQFTVSVRTNYVVSTNQKAKTENDASVDKQLIYVPMYSGLGKFSVSYKNIIVSYQQNYTGYRYTSTDNSEYLEPYWLANIYAAYQMDFKKCAFHVFVQVNNLFNEQYQVLLNRAMPLINYQTGFSIQFNKQNNSHQ